uniref:Uncharacterized protein n=1 Tax=Sinocyclocheilus rhinocerous TaxID=307959 RepID=A0A673HK83_9TELE
KVPIWTVWYKGVPFEKYVFLILDIQLKQANAGSDQIIVGVSPIDDIFCLNKNANNVGTSGNALWTQIAGKMSYYSCGPYSSESELSRENRHQKGLTGACCGGSGVFEAISGSLSMIEVATDGNVFGVDPQGSLLQRIGVIDTRWTAIICPNGHKHVTFDLGRLYVICSDVSFRRCV